MKGDFGRYLYGAAAMAFGVLMFRWHDAGAWSQFQPIGKASFGTLVMYVAALAALAGGLAMLWRPAARFGTMLVGAVYLVFTVLAIPPIVRGPLIYNDWGNFFEQLSLFSGALIAYGVLASGKTPWAPRAATIGRYAFGVSVVSFALEQWFYLSSTAGFVPKWIPLGSMFWAIATTIAFGLAALAVLSGYKALLASRLLTAMLVLFGIIIWLPTLHAAPIRFNWSETVETFAIAGVAWMLADLLGRARR